MQLDHCHLDIVVCHRGGGAGPFAGSEPVSAASDVPDTKPTGAEMPTEGRLQSILSVDYSSVYINEQSSRWSALVDMEIDRRGSLPDLWDHAGFSISAQIPFVSMSNGFLGWFLENFHDAFGLPNYGREDRAKTVSPTT